MTTQTAPTTSDSDHDDDDEVLHYVRADQITASVVEGAHVVALCGETFQVTKTSGLPICKRCKRILERMPK